MAMRERQRPWAYHMSSWAIGLGLMVIVGCVQVSWLSLWGVRIGGSLVILGALGLHAFRVWPPSCFILETWVRPHAD